MSDQYWDQTVLLLHFDAENGATYFRDERHHIVTPTGNAQISTAQKKFGAASLFLPGATLDYLSVTTDFNFLVADPFTIEFWVYVNTQTSNWSRPLMFGVNGNPASLSMWMNSANEFGFLGAFTDAVGVSAGGLTAGAWHHVALCSTGMVGTIFLNGVNVATSAFTRPSAGVNTCFIGADPDVSGQYGSTHFHGYFDDVRITKNVVRYTAEFTPPTAPFPDHRYVGDPHWDKVMLSMPMTDVALSDLKGHPVSQFGNVARSTNLAKFHGASAYFDGSGDYLTIPASPAFGFGTADFTVEFWVNASLTSGVNEVCIDARPSDSATPWRIGLTAAGAVRYYDGATVRVGGALVAGTWNHIAWCRASGVNKVYLNGAVVSTYTATQDFGASRGLTIGSNALTSAENIIGYLQGLRITKGVARYTNPFTPPTEPFPTFVPEALSGVVHDAAGNPIQRTARSYRRDTGQLIGTAVSDPITGLFSLPADNTDAHFVIVFDDVKNALIYDHITPVGAA